MSAVPTENGMEFRGFRIELPEGSLDIHDLSVGEPDPAAPVVNTSPANSSRTSITENEVFFTFSSPFTGRWGGTAWRQRSQLPSWKWAEKTRARPPAAQRCGWRLLRK